MRMLYGMIALGALLIIAPMGWSITKEVKLLSWTQTVGTIVDLGYHGDESPTATVEYQDGQLAIHSIRETVSFGTEVYKKVDVKYNPEAPSEAVVNHFFTKHFLTAILCPIGFLFSLTGYIILISENKNIAIKHQNDTDIVPKIRRHSKKMRRDKKKRR